MWSTTERLSRGKWKVRPTAARDRSSAVEAAIAPPQAMVRWHPDVKAEAPLEAASSHPSRLPSLELTSPKHLLALFTVWPRHRLSSLLTVAFSTGVTGDTPCSSPTTRRPPAGDLSPQHARPAGTDVRHRSDDPEASFLKLLQLVVRRQTSDSAAPSRALCSNSLRDEPAMAELLWNAGRPTRWRPVLIHAL